MNFQAGKTYTTRSICDHDCIFSMQVVSRTAKTVRAVIDGREEKTLRVALYNGVEFARPLGSYSMAPIIRAA